MKSSLKNPSIKWANVSPALLALLAAVLATLESVRRCRLPNGAACGFRRIETAKLYQPSTIIANTRIHFKTYFAHFNFENFANILYIFVYVYILMHLKCKGNGNSLNLISPKQQPLMHLGFWPSSKLAKPPQFAVAGQNSQVPEWCTNSF